MSGRNPIIGTVTLPPGAVMVVGPNGRAVVSVFANGMIRFDSAVRCDLVGPDHMTPAHRALVDERWSDRTESGDFIQPIAMSDDLLPDLLKGVEAKPDPEIRRAQPKDAYRDAIEDALCVIDDVFRASTLFERKGRLKARIMDAIEDLREGQADEFIEDEETSPAGGG